MLADRVVGLEDQDLASGRRQSTRHCEAHHAGGDHDFNRLGQRSTPPGKRKIRPGSAPMPSVIVNACLE
jgi:hypothetical protein